MVNAVTTNLKKLIDKPLNWLDKSLKEAPPSVRDLMVAYVPLQRVDEAGGNEPVGNFVPELYELAKAGELRAQRELQAWLKQHQLNLNDESTAVIDRLKAEKPYLFNTLYHANGQNKTPFQLAVVPSFTKNMVQKHLEREYKYRRDLQLALPPMVSKFRVLPDYLRDIQSVGLRAQSSPEGIRINIKNPQDKLMKREKILHFIAQWGALLVTVTGAITVGVTSPWMFALAAVAFYLAKRTGNDFGLYDVAEALHRDIGWLTSKSFGWKGKFSLSKTLESGLYLAALGFVAYFAVTAAWAGAIALPCWSWMSTLGVSAGILEATQMLTAGVLATLAGAATWAGVSFPVRYFWGLSCYDNQIRLTADEVNALPVINNQKDLIGAMDRKCQQVLDKLNQPKFDLNQEQQADLEKVIVNQFAVIKERCEQLQQPKAANEVDADIEIRSARNGR